MNLNFKKGRITLVLGPFDMRCGFRKLALAASALLDIDVMQGRDYVVFVSRDRKLAKIVWCDETGGFVLSRKLNEGRFQRFLRDATSRDTRDFSSRDLSAFLDGDPLVRARRTQRTQSTDLNQESSISETKLSGAENQ